MKDTHVVKLRTTAACNLALSRRFSLALLITGLLVVLMLARFPKYSSLLKFFLETLKRAI